MLLSNLLFDTISHNRLRRSGHSIFKVELYKSNSLIDVLCSKLCKIASTPVLVMLSEHNEMVVSALLILNTSEKLISPSSPNKFQLKYKHSSFGNSFEYANDVLKYFNPSSVILQSTRDKLNKFGTNCNMEAIHLHPVSFIGL